MSDLALFLSRTELDIKKQVSKVEKLEEISQDEKLVWEQAAKEDQDDAKIIWDAALDDVAAARRGLTALKQTKEVLLRKLPSGAGANSSLKSSVYLSSLSISHEFLIFVRFLGFFMPLF
jgi:hypothetical protein